MSDIIPGLTSQEFQFEGRTVRTSLNEKGEPLFVAKDVCEALDITNHNDAISGLDDDEKGVVTTDTLGGRQKASAVTESGLYALIFTSRKTEAKRFKKWVTSEVLPAIRKTGQYAMAGSGPVRAVRELQFKLKAAELRAEASALEARAARVHDLPGAEAISDVIRTRFPDINLGRLGRAVQKIVAELNARGLPTGKIRRKGAWTTSALRTDIEPLLVMLEGW
jgi:prophage antirepressor-like protein